MRANTSRMVAVAVLGVSWISAVGTHPAVAQSVALATGERHSGRLEASDPRAEGEGRYDEFAYAARAGERIVIHMRSPDFDALVRWGRGAGGAFQQLAWDDDSGDGTDARLEAIAEDAGTYLIRATSFSADGLGMYILEVANEDSPSALPLVTAGRSVEGRLGPDDPRAPDGAYYHSYLYVASAGDRIVITMRSPDFDTYLSWGRADPDYDQHDDDSGGGTDSRLVVTASASGTYVIRAKGYREGATGAYTLHVERSTGAAAPSSPTPVASAPSRTGSASAGVSISDIRAYLERGLTGRRALGIETGQIARYHSMSVHRFFQVDRSARYTVALIFESGPTRVGEVEFDAYGGLAERENSLAASYFERPFEGYEMAAWEYTGQELLDAFSGSQYGVQFVVSIDQPEYRNAVVALLVSP